MSDFVDTFESIDALLVSAIGDDATIEGEPVRGVFDSPFIGPQIGGTRTNVSEPRFTARNCDVENAAVGHVLRHRDIDYVIVRTEPTGDGISALVLRRV